MVKSERSPFLSAQDRSFRNLTPLGSVCESLLRRVTRSIRGESDKLREDLIPTPPELHHGRDALVPATNDEAQPHPEGVRLVPRPCIIKDCAILQGAYEVHRDLGQRRHAVAIACYLSGLIP